MAQTVGNVHMDASTTEWNAVDLGYTDGEITIKLEEQLKEITSHQTGTEEIGHIRTGSVVEITLNLKETSVAQMKSMIALGGGSVTPDGGTEVFGWGSAQQFQPTYAQAKKLVIHPIHMGTSKARDFNVWKAYPQVGEIVLSGEEHTMIPVTFKCYRDTTKHPRIDKIFIGDGTQDLDADSEFEPDV